MNELIKIKKHDVLVQAVCGRELHARLEIKQEYANWIKAQIERARLVEGVDFVRFDEKVKANNATLKQVALTIEASKNIGMMCGTDKGFEIRSYFIQCEKQLMAQQPRALTKLEWIRLALEQEEQLQRLTGENQNLHLAIDNIFGYCSILRAAQFVGIHESTFNWKVLKAKAICLHLPPKKVPSPRYEYQLLYPIQAFVECYPQYDYDGLVPHNFLETPEIK